MPVLHEANKNKPAVPVITALRPPEERPMSPPIVAGVIVTGIFLAFKVWLVAAMALAASGYFLWQSRKYNREVLPRRLDDWRHSYICRKCRTTFVWRQTAEAEDAQAQRVPSQPVGEL